MITGKFYYDEVLNTIMVCCQEQMRYDDAPRCIEIAGRIHGKSTNILDIASCTKQDQKRLVEYLQRSIAQKNTMEFPKESFLCYSLNSDDKNRYMPAIQYANTGNPTEITSFKELNFFLAKIVQRCGAISERQIETARFMFLALHPEFTPTHTPTLHL